MKWSFEFFRRAIRGGWSSGNDTIRAGALCLSIKASFSFFLSPFMLERSNSVFRGNTKSQYLFTMRDLMQKSKKKGMKKARTYTQKYRNPHKLLVKTQRDNRDSPTDHHHRYNETPTPFYLHYHPAHCCW